MPRVFFFFLIFSSFLYGANQCISCHGGIEHIREETSGMTKAILEVADKAGHQGNDCIVCHGGNPTTKKKKSAHSGTVKYFKTNKGPKEFYPAPGSAWINQNTCGMCHESQVKAQNNSLMMTSQGKIHSALLSFGAKDGHKHNVGNYETSNPSDPHARLGSKTYQAYMDKLSQMEPQVFSSEISKLPDAPTATEVQEDPSLAVYTYLRQECLRCHTGSKGTKDNYRGLGCASCHIPYSKDGLYKGLDKSISKKERGHLLVHSIQSSRDVKVKIEEKEYSGVPVSTCSTCHDSGKSIANSYQGLMQKENHSSKTKKYIHMKEDIHFQKGMLCQDCHTSNDLHGDGFLSGANLASVEVECQDCHGTTKDYPWELPLGYSDEFNTTSASGEARGVSSSVAEYLKKGSVSEANDGYILSARGNPFPHATRVGDEIKIELANGKDIILKPLKKLKESKKLSKKALVAMDKISTHTDSLECYTCHASWAPQYYGNEVVIDYSAKKKNIDYLKAAHDHDKHGVTAGMKNLKKYLVDGEVTQTTSFVRWEDPALSQNGEGRISPTVPSYQTTLTVIGKDKKELFKSDADKNPNSISMATIQPHTITKQSRSCESCHTSKKAMGMGIGGLRATNTQFDYSKFLDKNATKLQKVGVHFKLSSSLNKSQRDNLDRSGVCFSCHADIPEGNLAISTMTHMAEMMDIKIDNEVHNEIVNKTLNIAAWIQVIVGILIALFTLLFIYVTFIKKKPINPRNEGWK